MQGRGKCLQGAERLQGSGLLGHDQGEVRRRQGQVFARLIEIVRNGAPFRERGPVYAGSPFHDNLRQYHRLIAMREAETT